MFLAIDLGELRDVVADFIGKAGVRETITAVIEVGLLGWFFYAMLRFLHGTRGLAVVKGMLMLGLLLFAVLYLVSEMVGLSFARLEVAAAYLLPTLVVGLVILFQPELRRGLSRLSEARSARTAPSQLSDLAAGFANMGRQRTGALVVFEQKTGVSGLYDTGVPLDAALSGAMLESIFYPKSPLHDGAVIVQGNRIVAASVTLPLTDSTSVSRDLGTRHRAALGLTEETDAVAVVVSEETGQISVAHRGELHPVDDEEQLVETFLDLLETYQPEEQRRQFHPWQWFRRDIGRKVGGSLLALVLWLLLQSQLMGEQDQRLGLSLVATQAEAEVMRRTAPAVYVVVPDGFMVRRDRLVDPVLNPGLRNERVRVEYKGLKRNIRDLELSTLISIDPEDLQGQDEKTIEVELTARLFRDASGASAELMDFDADPGVLRIPVERRRRAVFQLTSANVALGGAPATGYQFDESQIRLEPNLVSLSGPASRIEELLADPASLRLAPVSLDGSTLAVSQVVGLDATLAEGVTLETHDGLITVTVPIKAQPLSMELLLVPVAYVNADALVARGWSIQQATETLDLVITGPTSVLSGRNEDWLRQRIALQYDWRDATLMRAKERVRIITDLDGELARHGVQVSMMDGRVPVIEYQLEAAPGPEPVSTDGNP